MTSHGGLLLIGTHVFGAGTLPLPRRRVNEPAAYQKPDRSRFTLLLRIDARGRRPVHGGIDKFQTDPHWRDLILFFYEYFHGDNGAGLGASHQTGWTGLVAKLIELYGLMDPDRVLASGKKAVFVQGARKGEAVPGARIPL